MHSAVAQPRGTVELMLKAPAASVSSSSEGSGSGSTVRADPVGPGSERRASTASTRAVSYTHL